MPPDESRPSGNSTSNIETRQTGDRVTLYENGNLTMSARTDNETDMAKFNRVVEVLKTQGHFG
jgi:hypothetical protein